MKISVVIPTYQHAGTLVECLDSVFAQTYKDLEVIVVDDGSTDHTQEVLKPYQNRATIIHQENRGSNPARNRGLQESTGEFIIFLDADVTMEKEMIEKLIDALRRHPEASIAYSGFRFGWKTFAGVPFDPSMLKKMNYIHTSSLVRKADFPGFDEQIRRLQDWDVWLTMIEQGKRAVLVPEVLFSVKIHGASRTGSSWLPSFMYKIPWHLIGWRPLQIQKYEDAREILKSKHHL